MYICQITGKYSKQGEKLNKITVETRPMTYKHWDREAEEEWFSQGTEIVREVNACEEGVKLWDGWTPEEREAFLKHGRSATPTEYIRRARIAKHDSLALDQVG
jgi:hypothetical protein